jgi:hypothetical protein
MDSKLDSKADVWLSVSVATCVRIPVGAILVGRVSECHIVLASHLVRGSSLT